MTVPDLERTLDAISGKVLAPTPYPYVELEGFRLARAVVVMVQGGRMPVERLLAWLHKLEGDEPGHKAYAMGRDNVPQHNTVSLLTALHMMLMYKEVPAASREQLLPAAHTALRSSAPWFV